jgi:hypothetical protein
MPLYYGERSWNSLNLRSFFQSVDAGGVTPTTYATSRLDLSNGVMTEREENSPLTSVISVQRNSNDGFGVGMTKPTGNPLSEGEGHRLPASPDLELPRDFQRAASQSGVTGGGDAPIKIIGFHPGIKETEWVAKTEGAGAFLFDEALADEVLDDARDETRTGLRAVNQLALNPNPIAVRQESADDAGTFTYEDVSRLQLEAEIAAWQGATVHKDAG